MVNNLFLSNCKGLNSQVSSIEGNKIHKHNNHNAELQVVGIKWERKVQAGKPKQGRRSSRGITSTEHIFAKCPECVDPQLKQKRLVFV